MNAPLKQHSQWPFPSRHKTITPQAEQILASSHTPEQLEAAIKAQGDLVEFHHMCGRNAPAREAFDVVKKLVALRTPETVARMDRERGLGRA